MGGRARGNERVRGIGKACGNERERKGGKARKTYRAWNRLRLLSVRRRHPHHLLTDVVAGEQPE
ncbi:hypothetical protein, partial [Halorubrum sp. Hd13]|uniref:hypothetical protein n=1 Tax=Halorubrum sp. Hd13 TaxID=1480728 RepID=UPI001BAEE097